MGLSFSGYRKELSSRGFKRAYERLRAGCPELFPFADPSALITFFHDQAADLDRKDTILFNLITEYRNDDRHRDIAPLFIVLFTPALASIYTFVRRSHPSIDREDLIQDLCLFLIQIIRESAITQRFILSPATANLNRLWRRCPRHSVHIFLRIQRAG